MRAGLFLLWALAVTAEPARALELRLPRAARPTGETVREPDSYLLPVAPFRDGALPVVETEGRVETRAWRIDTPGITSLQMVRPLRTQLSEAGYDVILDCGARECGGFDFRFGTRVLPAPAMFVDLFDYRFVSARKPEAEDGSAGARYASILASTAGGAGYVQVIMVDPGKADTDPDGPGPGPAARRRGGGSHNAPDTAVKPADTPDTTGDAAREAAPEATALDAALLGRGHAILDGLDFATGSADLGAGPHPVLAALATFLGADPARRVLLVGHTDATGGLAENTRLSRARARAVRDRLTGRLGVSAAQLSAEGAGYLAPVAPNGTAAGREANRRVEAVLLAGD